MSQQQHDATLEPRMSKRARHGVAADAAVDDSGWNPLLARDTGAMVAPDFNCSATLNGQTSRFQLSACLVEHQAVVLFFIGSNMMEARVQMDLDLINTHLSRFKALQALPLAMSTAPAERAQDTCSSVGFPVLSDLTRSVSRYFNVLDAASGSARRAAFILDTRRRIRYSFVLGDDRLNHSINTMLALLESVVSAAG